MRFIKHKLCDLPSCYAAAQIEVNGRTRLLLAPDAPGPCYSFDSQTFEKKIIWPDTGGTMSLVPWPGGRGDFLAVQRFYPGFQAQAAEIVHVFWENSQWRVNTFLKLPYVHRFDILERAGIHYLITCTLCNANENAVDWSSPGIVYAAELPGELPVAFKTEIRSKEQPLDLLPIASGMTLNHGYWQVKNNGYTSALTACSRGVFEMHPPIHQGASWDVRRILDRPVSDIALSDIDEDGQAELAAIEPFHGNEFVVYRKSGRDYLPIYRYPAGFSFGHVVWGGKLRGEDVFIGGGRSGRRELFLLRWNDGKIKAEIIETGSGPANVSVINGRQHDLLLVANHETGEGALFIVKDD